MRTLLLLVGAGVAAALFLAMAAVAQNLPANTIERPRGSSALTASLPMGTVYLFDAKDFKGNVTRLDNITARPAGAPMDVAERGQSSVQWNLPPGVLVVIYQENGGKGGQLPLWGQGQLASLDPSKMNNQVRQWAWYYIGGVPDPSPEVQKGLSARPLGAGGTTEMVMGMLELYADDGLRGRLTSIGPVTSVAPAAIQSVGTATDRMSSLRWNLPPGAVLVLYEGREGEGRQLALWGSGQYFGVRPMDFNDRVAAWAWCDISGAQRRAP